MVQDAEAREAVRRLMRLSDSISDQLLNLAYVLAKQNRDEYQRLLEASEIAAKTVIQPLKEADAGRSEMYRALDDPSADWSKEVAAMFNRGPIQFTGDAALQKLKLMQSLEERFDEEMKKRDASGERGKEA